MNSNCMINFTLENIMVHMTYTMYYIKTTDSKEMHNINYTLISKSHTTCSAQYGGSIALLHGVLWRGNERDWQSCVICC